MLILNLPDDWTVWPTAISQVLVDPRCERPGVLAEIMGRTTKVRAAERLGDTQTGLAFLQDHREDILSAARGERTMDYLNNVGRDLKTGDVFRPLMVGLILLLALDWDTTGQQRVSLNQIYDKIAGACQNRIWGSQKRELMRSWKIHRPAAHLWAALLLFQSEWRDICHSHQRLLLWLAHAEALRGLGAGCRLWRSPKHSRLLDLDETWCLLPSDPLPEVNVRIPSSDAIMSALARTSTQD
jgi:hypothetical protein